MVTRRLHISGRVQGVGFRYSMRHEAARRGVRGWVRNRADGSVEALLAGDAEAIEALTAWARQGPPGAKVTEVQVLPAAEDAVPEGFELRATL
jgi:acylphosphatase